MGWGRVAMASHSPLVVAPGLDQQRCQQQQDAHHGQHRRGAGLVEVLLDIEDVIGQVLQAVGALATREHQDRLEHPVGVHQVADGVGAGDGQSQPTDKIKTLFKI